MKFIQSSTHWNSFHISEYGIHHPSYFCGSSKINGWRDSPTYTRGTWHGNKIFKNDFWLCHKMMNYSTCWVAPLEFCQAGGVETLTRCLWCSAVSLLLATWPWRDFLSQVWKSAPELPTQLPHHYNNHMTTTSSCITMATTAPLLRQQLQTATTHVSNLVI